MHLACSRMRLLDVRAETASTWGQERAHSQYSVVVTTKCASPYNKRVTKGVSQGATEGQIAGLPLQDWTGRTDRGILQSTVSECVDLG